MAPSFLKDIRRRSKASCRTDKSSSNETDGTTTGSAPMTSSSTVNSAYGASTPPPLTTSNSAANLNGLATTPPLPGTRSSATPSGNHRHSMSGMAGLGALGQSPTLASSQYAPRVLSITENSAVYQKVLSIYGVIGDSAAQGIQGMEGNLTISRLDDGFPPTYWPVEESQFKALLYLLPGPNQFRFDFTSPKLANSNNSNKIHSSYLRLYMSPVLAAPPLQLVILLGKDSPGEFDSSPSRIEKEGNNLETAIRKFRMAAYLWQAFTSEQMYRNRLGRRVFRIDEEWTRGTSSTRDRETGAMRSEARIHVIRSSKTVAEIRDLDIAQQNPNATRQGELFGIATEAVNEYFKPSPGQKQYVSVLILDAHWDTSSQTILGHAALGGGGGDLQLAIFRSHALHSYPSCIEEVVPAFSDCTPTDVKYVANDCNESGSSWEAANIGIGAHLHETGHLFGCPHQASGIMLRDYVRLNRSFTIREPYSTRTKSKGGLVLPKDECGWHRLDCLRFRSHPCFALPIDPPRHSDNSIHVWPVDNGSVIVTAPSGVAYFELFCVGDQVCEHFQEYHDGNGGQIQRQIVLTEIDLRARLPEEKKKSTLRLSIKSIAGGSHEIANFSILASKASRLKLPNGQIAFRSSKLGLSQMDGSTPQEVVFDSAVQQTKLLTQIKVWHGFALDGIEFCYEDSTSQLFGKRGGSGSEFALDTRRGEIVTGFYVRSGFWIDGIAIMTSLGRKSAVFGNATGGSGHTLIPPRGYSIAGVIGSSGDWVDGFGILIIR